MAYISAEDVAAIRKELKLEFPKCKFAVRKGAASLSVDVSIMRSPFKFKDTLSQSRHAHVNHYWIQDHFKDPAEQAFLLKVNEIMHNAPGRAGGKKYFDESDAMVDYFHTAFYVHLSIGQWNKDYECMA